MDINGTGRCFVFVLQLLVFVLHHLMPRQPLIRTEGYKTRDIRLKQAEWGYRDRGKGRGYRDKDAEVEAWG